MVPHHAGTLASQEKHLQKSDYRHAHLRAAEVDHQQEGLPRADTTDDYRSSVQQHYLLPQTQAQFVRPRSHTDSHRLNEEELYLLEENADSSPGDLRFDRKLTQKTAIQRTGTSYNYTAARIRNQ